MVKAAQCYIALGANLNSPIEQLEQAIKLITNKATNVLIHTSSIYESAPISDIEQARFYNAVINIKTLLSPLKLLKELQAIEHHMGRVRQQHWGPRVIDLDILVYDEQQWASNTLQLPHPRIQERQFVLQPLQEIAPHLVINNTPINTLAENCEPQDINQLSTPLRI